MVPANERLDLRVHPKLKLAIVQAKRENESVNQCATRLLCQALKLKTEDYTLPHKPTGRPAKTKQPEEE